MFRKLAEQNPECILIAINMYFMYYPIDFNLQYCNNCDIVIIATYRTITIRDITKSNYTECFLIRKSCELSALGANFIPTSQSILNKCLIAKYFSRAKKKLLLYLIDNC